MRKHSLFETLLVFGIVVPMLGLCACTSSFSMEKKENGCMENRNESGLFDWFYQNQQAQFEESTAFVPNPGMGFAASADNYDEAKQSELVYVDITWREWEPQPGVYDWDGVIQSNNLEEWVAEGKQLVLRFVCDVPGKTNHLDIPDWLYEETGGDGTHYVGSLGMGYSPNYENPVLMGRHKRAIAELGARILPEDLAYVELGSLGHWGEWHVSGDPRISPMPGDEICERYLLDYRQAFPETPLLMRRPYALGKVFELGIYNDMTGAEADTREWLGWIEAGDPGTVPEVVSRSRMWETCPVGGEFTSSIDMNVMLGRDLEKTLSLIRQSHMSFIGPKCPTTDHGSSETAIQAVKKELGYRFYIPSIKLSGFPWLGSCRLQVRLKNTGNAPCYRKGQLLANLYDQNGVLLGGKLLCEDIRSIQGGTDQSFEVELDQAELEKTARCSIGIRDSVTGEFTICFAQKNEEGAVVNFSVR